MVREIELSEELWRTRFLIELCYLDDRKIVWCVNMFSSNLSVTKVLSILQRWRMFDQNSQLSNFQLESLILAQNERWRHGLGMQVERTTSVESSGRVRNA